jgi:hypothetical protein
MGIEQIALNYGPLAVLGLVFYVVIRAIRGLAAR